MLDRSFSDLNINDIEALISNSATEGNNLEFKREVWSRSDDGIREMLKDISAMANAYGGIIVVGMDENSTTGKALALVDVPNAEQERDRILASCLSNIQPRILGLDIKTLETNQGKNILLIYVPSSLNLHQITYKNFWQFHKRHDRQIVRMSYDEIKDAIIKNSGSTEQSLLLLQKRIERLKMNNSIRMILQAVPIKLETELFRILNMDLRNLLRESENERREGWNFNFMYAVAKPSLNGLIIGKDNELVKTLEFYRNGYLEGIIKAEEGRFYTIKELNIEGITKSVCSIRTAAVVEYIYSFIKKLKALSNFIGYDSPYCFTVSLLNIEGMEFQEDQLSSPWNGSKICDTQSLEIGPLIYESINPEIIAKELADRIWQAFGFEQEPYFKGGSLSFN